jgi:alkylhydroperoxidase family enzyme
MIAGRVAGTAVLRQVRHVVPVAAAAASGPVEAVYAQIAEEMHLVVPPALLHSPAPGVLAAYWALTRETLLVAGATGRGVKEAVATAVATSVLCPYCVDMHSVNMYDLIGEYEAERLVTDRIGDLRDPHLREIGTWARFAYLAPHAPSLPEGLTPAQRAELVGTVTGLHYLSRTVNVFLAPSLLPPGITGRARRRLKRGLGRLLGPTLRAHREPGRSLGLLPGAPPPADARWAAANPWIAGAVARAAATFEAAGERHLSPALRRALRDRLDAWHGEEPVLPGAWCEEALAGFREADRAAGRVALLTAVASRRVTDEDIADFRRHLPGDDALVEVVAWAAYEAARRIGARQETR